MKTYIPTNRIPSAMAKVENAGQVKPGKSFGWNLRDIMLQKREQTLRTVIADTFRARADHRNGSKSNAKISILKRQKGGMWHATGIGDFEAKDFGAAKEVVRTHGYTGLRQGCISVKFN